MTIETAIMLVLVVGVLCLIWDHVKPKSPF